MPGVDNASVTHQRLLRTMDTLAERAGVLQHTLAAVLRPLIDQDLSIVFDDMTTIGVEGQSEMAGDMHHFGLSKDAPKRCVMRSRAICRVHTATRYTVRPPTGSSRPRQAGRASTHLVKSHGARRDFLRQDRGHAGPPSRAGRARLVASARPEQPMHTLWIAFAGVALAEVGDKTQLLSLVLAARYRRPWPIMLGILVATLVNHALAALAGAWLGTLLTPTLQRWLVGLSLLAVAAWTLKPDHVDSDVAAPMRARGVFVTTTLAFFLAEMGDKTQIATLILGADFHPYWQVVAGSTLGMLAVNVPTVWLGARYARRIPLELTRTLAALLFAALGLWVLLR